MEESTRHEPSTLASLAPDQSFAPSLKSLRGSARPQGSHTMALKKISRLPESSREYVPGDPVNRIDWRAFARSDQLIIREVRDEAQAVVRIAIDGSSTMDWPKGELPGAPQTLPPRKEEVALRIGLHLGCAHASAGDRVEIWLMAGDEPGRVLVPRAASDLKAVYNHQIQSGFRVSTVEASPFVSGSSRADIGIWIGDALETGGTLEFLEPARRKVMLHVLSHLEMDTSWFRSDVSYFEEGGGTRKEYPGKALTYEGRYEAELRRWQDRWSQALERLGGDYLCVSDATPVGVFHRFLASIMERQPA